jgi:hypothetical protein
MKFKEGDRVICIDITFSNKPIELNTQYIIKSVLKHPNNRNCVKLLNFYDKFYFYEERFKLDEKYYRKEKIKKLKNEI